MPSWVAYANFRCGCPTAEAWEVCCAFLGTRPAIRKAGNHHLPNDPSKCNVWASARSLSHSSVTWVLLSYKVMTGGLSSWQYNLSTGDLYRYDHKVLNRNFFKEKKNQQTTYVAAHLPWSLAGFTSLGKSFQGLSRQVLRVFPLTCTRSASGCAQAPKGRMLSRVGASEQSPMWQES